MSTHNNHPPVETHRDGAVSAKIWRNLNKDGKPFYSVTFQRTYTDPGSGNISESRSFQGTDVLKIPNLASDAYRTILQMREMDKTQKVDHQLPLHDHDQQPTRNPVGKPQAARQLDAAQGSGLAQQRDAAMAASAAPQPQGNAPERGPGHDRTPER